MRLLIWNQLLQPWRYYGKGTFIYILFSVFTVFVAGIVIDIVREKIFADWMDKTADRVVEKIKNCI